MNIKIIDLLVKMANRKPLPKEIKYFNEIYKFTGYEKGKSFIYLYENEYGGNLFDMNLGINDEVEILDEQNKIEEKRMCIKCGRHPAEYNQTYCEYCLGISKSNNIEKLDVALLGQCDNWLQNPIKESTLKNIELNPYIIENLRENTLKFQHKLNELIDKVNSLDEDDK